MTLKTIGVAALAAALLGATSSTDLRASLRSTATRYYEQITSIAPVVGSDTAVDFLQRLNDDGDLMDSTDVPAGYSPETWKAFVRQVATLDLSVADQLLAHSFQPMSEIRGFGEAFVKSSKDGTMQPVAVYVPASYSPGRPAPLVVFLHGYPQSETQLIAPEFIANLAERTGTIVVAPYGRGYMDFHGSTSDVYDALDAATKAFDTDSRKRYLAGYSMGGFSVFEIAPVHPNAWSAIMCISGGLLNKDAHDVTAELSSKSFYVLTGAKDDSIPTQYPTATAIYLSASGLPVSFYSLSDGSHRMITLLPILAQAWEDMHHGIVRSPPPVLGNFGLPSAPMGMTKP
jgi:predicted esterase